MGKLEYTDEQRRGLRYRDLFYKTYYPGWSIPVDKQDINIWAHLYKTGKASQRTGSKSNCGKGVWYGK